MQNNYAFIDGQNVNLGFQKRLGWKVDWRKLRVHLKDRYHVSCAYYFVGYMPENTKLYTALQRFDYKLIFKPVTYQEGKPKGNVDAELVLQAMIDINEYDKAVIVSSDGDFRCLVNHLRDNGKLERVLSPNRAECSALLKRAAGPKIDFLEDARSKIEYKK